jgi:small subunit ribosomal protein S4
VDNGRRPPLDPEESSAFDGAASAEPDNNKVREEEYGMGDPKKQRKKYESPRFPWSITELNSELRLVGEYGLRNKRELRRHSYTISKYRALARQLLAIPDEERVKLETQLLNKLQSIKVISENAGLDDVLDLSVAGILERRLQTLVFRNGLARTPQQARQLVVHGHISIGNRKITSPSYIVPRDEEQDVHFTPTSFFAKTEAGSVVEQEVTAK